MKLAVRNALPFGAGFLILIVLLLPGFFPGEDSKDSPLPLAPVVTVKARQDALARTVRVTGITESDNQITLVPRIPGRIDDIMVRTGERVNKNTPVALIDPEAYRLSLTQAESAYDSSRSTYERLSSLYEAGAVSEEDYTRARAQYESLKSQYELALLRYGYTTLTSPIAGTVLVKHINRGAMAGTETPVLTIGSVSDLSVRTPVPEADLPYFREVSDSLVGSITCPSLEGVELRGKIESVAPYVSPGSGQFSVTLDLDESPLLRPGMFLYVTYNLEIRDNLWSLPLEAITGDGKLWHVDGEDRAVRLDYEPLFETDSRCAVPGEWKDYRFILEGQNFLVPGQSVRVTGDERL